MAEQQQHQPAPRIYTLEQIEAAVEKCGSTFERDLIQAVEDGFVAFSQGRFNAAPIQTMGAPPMAPYSCNTGSRNDDDDKTMYAAQTCVKSGYVTGDDHFCIKVASGGYPLPANSGLLQVYSQRTGRLETLLLDEGILTEHRTAAAGALAAQHLLLKKKKTTTIDKIGILGTGVQARYQLRYLKCVTDCRNVLVWGRTTHHVEAFVTEMNAGGYWNVQVTDTPNDLLEQCDLIVTVTSAREALILTANDSTDNHNKFKRPQLITCIGADAPGKMELDPHLVASADLLVTDSRLQTAQRGEFQTALASGLVQLDDIRELGEVVVIADGGMDASSERRQDINKEEDNLLTIFDSSGVAVQDCAVAKLAAAQLLTTTTASTENSNGD